MDDAQLLSTTLYDLTVMSANYAWSRNRLQRLQQQQTFFNFVGTLRGLKRLTLSGGWPICETEAFPLGKQALPDYLESYIGPAHFFRSAPEHRGLKTAAFTERHITAAELLLHLPSLPNATRVAIMGICLEDDGDNEASALDIIFKQCPNIKEFLFDSAHVPVEGAISVVKAFRQSIHRLHMIEYIIVPRINGTDLQPSEAFNPLHDICSSLVGVQFQEKMWVRMGEQWKETEV
ncbi:uncharacterized protein C8R40DRAFT_1100962 [Lentinula edodes]|uniref:uncharacterized protein n=1 Tax=Lentinula edodes TaxID=5353 RepID=UPI001E8D7DF5|nr:uncharacterized protein C8R40DRAFT_1100962 [Lentinula edodes]KAH7876139.1 hypothetical protein C8R40DRAFT_1100962 [Lentinula edodes]